MLSVIAETNTTMRLPLGGRGLCISANRVLFPTGAPENISRDGAEAACWAHNPEVKGSSPFPASISISHNDRGSLKSNVVKGAMALTGMSVGQRLKVLAVRKKRESVDQTSENFPGIASEVVPGLPRLLDHPMPTLPHFFIKQEENHVGRGFTAARAIPGMFPTIVGHPTQRSL